MRNINNKTFRVLIPSAFMLVICFSPIVLLAAEEDAVADEKRLLTDEVNLLENRLSEMKALAQKLRVSLRSVQSQAGFNIRESHKLERNLSSSRKDLERLIAMHRRGAVNQVRAHFLVDDLRRNLRGLNESLGYIELHMQEQKGEPLPSATSETQTDGEQNALVELLKSYTLLVDESLTMLQEKGF